MRFDFSDVREVKSQRARRKKMSAQTPLTNLGPSHRLSKNPENVWVFSLEEEETLWLEKVTSSTRSPNRPGSRKRRPRRRLMRSSATFPSRVSAASAAP